MFGTVFSLIVAALLFLFRGSLDGLHESGWIPLTIIIIPAMLLLGQAIATISSWTPIQRAEVTLTSHIVDTFSKDKNLMFTNMGILAFFFISYWIAFDFAVIKTVPTSFLIIVWTVLLGITIDLKIHAFHRISKYLNPFEVVDMFSNNAQASIRDSNDLELCNWIDSLTETAIKAIHRKSTSLTIHCMNRLGEVIKTYLEAEKSLSHHEEVEAKEVGVSDPVSFMLFFIFQRLEMVNREAIQGGLEPICSDLMALLGKIAVYATHLDITLTGYPIHYMGKFAKQAQAHGLQEVADRATLTLLEVGRVILQEKNLEYLELKDPFMSIINHMDEIAKETFRKNKETNIKLLIQPFKDLKALFSAEGVATHRDTPVIVQSIDRVIDEFVTLETVMMAMPPLKEKSE